MTRRTLFLIGLALQLLLVLGMFLPSLWIMGTGELVSLRTRPVDPRSIFRGDYVTLAYEAGDLDRTGFIEPKTGPRYVVLEKKGEFHERVAVSDAEPELAPGQVCLRGHEDWTGIAFPDLGQYFVEEGLGRELESARNAHRLIVDAYVTPGCRAVIRGVRLGPEAPEGAWDPWSAPVMPGETKPIPTSASGAEVPVR